jgi:tRNA-specific 2-thiouridylase
MRIVVAMSGGVDSSVAAALLAEQGHDVIGLSMQLYPQGEGGTGAGGHQFGSCCTLDDLHDARRVASALGFPHYILNLEQRFQETVISNFVHEYASGRTPLPCAHCNSDLKFSTLLDRARGLGSDHVATGHYARIDRSATGRWLLRRSVDRDKDQSYFLFSLTQEQLAGAMFPVGSLSKPVVREEARRLGLAVADKADSQEICFLPDGDYASFVATRAPEARGGVIVDERGERLGSHGGVHRFTIGQRKGLGLATGAPLYVLKIDAESGDVTVGPRASLERTSLTASGVNWVSVDAPADWIPVSAQIRHRHRAAAGRVRALDDGRRAEFEFLDPQPAITPGQAVVFYDDDVVVGGGWIE